MHGSWLVITVLNYMTETFTLFYTVSFGLCSYAFMDTLYRR